MSLKTLFFGCLFAISSHAADLQSCCIGSTGAVPLQANAGPQTLPAWFNRTGSPIYITNVVAWIGLSQGAVSDVSLWVTRAADNFILWPLGWDHYLDSNSPNTYQWSFAPNYVCIPAGGAIIVTGGGGAASYNSLNYGYPGSSNQPGYPHALTIGFAVWIYYVTTQPAD
jgi:hypothetical protein